jgi:hypothetical protein
LGTQTHLRALRMQSYIRFYNIVWVPLYLTFIIYCTDGWKLLSGSIIKDRVTWEVN